MRRSRTLLTALLFPVVKQEACCFLISSNAYRHARCLSCNVPLKGARPRCALVVAQYADLHQHHLPLTKEPSSQVRYTPILYLRHNGSAFSHSRNGACRGRECLYPTPALEIFSWSPADVGQDFSLNDILRLISNRETYPNQLRESDSLTLRAITRTI